MASGNARRVLLTLGSYQRGTWEEILDSERSISFCSFPKKSNQRSWNLRANLGHWYFQEEMHCVCGEGRFGDRSSETV